MRTTAILGLLGLLSVAAPAARADTLYGGQLGGTYEYDATDRATRFVIRDGTASVVRLRQDIASAVDTDSAARFFAYAYDCSTSDFRCFQAGGKLLAVPRAGIRAGQASYFIAEVEFSVLACMDQRGPGCDVALIEADRQDRESESRSEWSPKREQNASIAGPIVYFIFDRRIGVVSLGFAHERTRSASERIALARTYVLRGEKGLLPP
jgi:hypothetical protein